MQQAGADEGTGGLAGAGPQRPILTFWQIWNMCFGFLGIQIGFQLQNSNMSRIFETLGARLDDISILWVAAPVTGLIVQPLIGYWSDRTWTAMGRRRPFFLGGALLASAALLAMPGVSSLWEAAGLLWILDASLNVAMEPFRAFVGDQMAPSQRARGYAMQGLFIGAGAVAAGAMPWLLAHLGVDNIAAAGAQADTVRWSFRIGAVALVGAMLWTFLRSKEEPPLEPSPHPSAGDGEAFQAPSANRLLAGLVLSVAGAAAIAAIAAFGLDKGLYVLAAGLLAYGLLKLAHDHLAPQSMVATLLTDLERMPPTMRALVPVQFFTWLAFFAMWIYTTGAVTQVHFGSSDTASAAYNEGANWVGVLFSGYNVAATVAALLVPAMARRWGMARAHMLNLGLGAAGLASFLVIRDPAWLLLSMVGVGFAWCSVVSLPYALLAGGVPPERMGTYMGIFNFFIVIPQIVAASVLGLLLRVLFGGAPIYALLLGAASLCVAAAFCLRLPQAQR